ncbi:MAG TPA: NAD(P)/FAD-dependent oxidoreductase [Candidatus Cloacimonetes bacterium]|nr:NAD(P)/FAD-dependent oxidoreductase [Candidatus Cloacimonadota bacterium]
MMLKDKYDVIVVGAGPAGSVTARFAAENGASVLMLERDREPGIPVRCAEGVSHEGIAPFIEIDESWIAAKIDVACLHAPDGTNAKMYNNGAGYILERRLFDKALCDVACRHGAELLTKADVIGLLWEKDKISGVKYRYFGKIHEIRCDLVIGADGVESRVGRWAGIKTAVRLEDIDTCVQYTLSGLKVEEGCVDFYFGNDIAPGGYIWIFPKSKNSANVGIGVAGHLSHKKGPQEYLNEFIEKTYPDVKKTYTVCGGVTTSATLKEIVRDNILLVGDAARQVNPLTGGGIAQGMIAGSIAGKVAAEAVRTGKFDKKFLKKYRKEWDKRLGRTQKTMFKMKEKFMFMGDDRFNKIAKICKNIPKEKFSLKALFTEAVKGDPKLMADVAKAFVVSKLKK